MLLTIKKTMIGCRINIINAAYIKRSVYRRFERVIDKQPKTAKQDASSTMCDLDSGFYNIAAARKLFIFYFYKEGTLTASQVTS